MKTAIISLLFAVFASALAGLSILKLENQQQYTSQTEQKLAKLESHVTALQNESATIQKSLSELLSQYRSLTAESAWKIAEVNHFLRMASLELQVSRNVSTTLRLLEAADAILSSLPDPKFFPVREAIAKEIANVGAIQFPDLEKLWLQVGGLMNQIPELKIRGIPSSNAMVSTNTNANANANANAHGNANANANANTQEIQNQNTNDIQISTEMITEAIQTSDPLHPHPKEASHDWKKGLASTWAELKDLVKLQRHSKPLEPILNETEQVLAREKLMLIFEQIRWAILNGNNTVYQQSLLEATQWLNQYFEAADKKTEALKQSLKDLAKINLRPALPNIEQSLKELNNATN